jgi:uncharacterized repeat protein (TIGR03803 family)
VQIVISVVIMLAASPAGAQTYSTLYSFQCQPDGSAPTSSVALDSAGNLYGATGNGGSYNVGTVFEVSPTGTERVLHSFTGFPSDGEYPSYTSLVLDAAGNIYGVTPGGGRSTYGVVYKLAPDGTETILHSFTSKGGTDPDGGQPYGGLVRDHASNLYGTTPQGGNGQQGTIFKVTPGGIESILYQFQSSEPSYNIYGQNPYGALVEDQQSNFYGTTYLGGTYDFGTVFKFSPTTGNTLLLSLAAEKHGKNPVFGLLRDPKGNLYGTVPYGGALGFGTVIGISAAGKATVLHAFSGAPDGGQPYSTPVRDSAGNLYGTTSVGGTGPCSESGLVGCGAIFEVTPSGQESVLYSFTGPPTDGEYPLAGLTIDKSGNLYGTTSEGGTYGCGTVFKYTP